MADTWQNIIDDALLEINVVGISDPLPPNYEELAIRFLNRFVDAWAGKRVYAWAESFIAYTLTPNHSPHLIGPNLAAPDFALPASSPVRPMRLDPDGAALILNTSTPAVDLPLNVRDADWWNNQRVKTLTTSVPTDVYYEPDFPNGSLYFWPVPDFAYGVRLRLWSVLAQITVANFAQTVIAPPGYALALQLTLAENLCGPMGRPVPATLPQRALKARAAIGLSNTASPRIASADYGTRGRTPGADFNYYTGGPADG